MKNISLDLIFCVEYLFVGFMVFGWDLKEIFGISFIRLTKHQINFLKQSRYFLNALFQINEKTI